jgi:hypothetical protein
MTAKLELDSDTKAPPSYDAVSISLGASIQRPRPSTPTVFSRVRTRTTVLSRIRDLVTTPNYTASFVVPTVNSCAEVLSTSEFSDLLQTCNIEGHTAMYWAIMNNRREALSALIGFIYQISLVCSDDLRLACMFTNDHALFTQLSLGRDVGCKCMIIPTQESIDQIIVYQPMTSVCGAPWVVCHTRTMTMRSMRGMEWMGRSLPCVSSRCASSACA